MMTLMQKKEVRRTMLLMMTLMQKKESREDPDAV